MQSRLYLDETLRRQIFPIQPIQSFGYWQQANYQPPPGALSAPLMPASGTAVPPINRPLPDYGAPGVRIVNSAEQNTNQGRLHKLNEDSIAGFNNGNLLLNDSMQQYPEQIFSELRSPQSQSNDHEELLSTLRRAHDVHSLSSSTNLLGSTYASDTRPQCPDDKEQGTVPPGRGASLVAMASNEGTLAPATSTRSTNENAHSFQVSNLIYSDTNLFVRFTPHTMDEEELVKLFSPYGNIESRGVMRNIHTGENIGKGFVRFETHEQAKKAMAAMNNPRESSTRYNITVQWAKREHDNVPTGKERLRMRKLFVRNIPPDVTVFMLEDLFRPFGALEEVTVHHDTSAAGHGASHLEERRIAFVTYISHGVAQKATDAIHNTYPFQSCNGIPLMAKLVEDYPTRPQKYNAVSSSPTHPWVPKKVIIMPSASARGVAQHEGSGSTTAFGISSSVPLHRPPKNGNAEYANNFSNAMRSGPMGSPFQSQLFPFETSDAACAGYSSPIEMPLAYAQIPLAQPLPVTNIAFTFSPEHSFQPTLLNNSGSGKNPNTGTATLLSPDMVQSASVSQGNLIYYSPQPSLSYANPTNWYTSTVGMPPSYTQQPLNTGNAILGYGNANTTIGAQTTSSVQAFQTPGDLQQFDSCKANQASQKDYHADIKSPPSSLPSGPLKNLNEVCSRFGKSIERLHHFSVANQELSALITTNNCEKPMESTVEKSSSSPLAPGVGGIDASCTKKNEEMFSAARSSTNSSGMQCFPSYTTSGSSTLSKVSYTSRHNTARPQTTPAVTETRDDAEIGELLMWTMSPNGPWTAGWALEEPNASQPLHHAGVSLALPTKDPHESSEGNVLDENERFASMLDSIASDT